MLINKATTCSVNRANKNRTCLLTLYSWMLGDFLLSFLLWRGHDEAIPHSGCHHIFGALCNPKNSHTPHSLAQHACQRNRTVIYHSLKEKSFTRHQNAFFRNHNPSLTPIPSPTFQSAPDEEVLSAVHTDVSLSCFFTGCRIDNCEACFSKDFCTKCKPDFYLHKGRCFEKCPEGFAPLEDSMECGGK